MAMISNTVIKWLTVPAIESSRVKWALDHPKPNQRLVHGESLRIKGWVLGVGNAAIRLIIKKNGETFAYSLTQDRPDVIRKILQTESEGHPQICCGFASEVLIDGDPIAIGFRFEGENHWVGVLSFKNNKKVIEGLRGNLFLGNDTNHCVEQYEGKHSISDEELINWKNYFDVLQNLRHEALIQTLLLIAPGKEFIHSEDFPYTRGTQVPVDKIIEAFDKQSLIFYPVDELLVEKDATYSTSDTHWTDYGALIAARSLCEKLGEKYPGNMPPFQIVMKAGDLGNKLLQPVKRAFFQADFSNTNVKLIFSNGVHNHGRVRLYQNSAAPSNQRVLLFGDSFSVNLAPWLCLCYTEVLYVHTAGSIDLGMLNRFKPDVMIAQTNTRFLVRSPLATLNLDGVIASKLDTLTDDDFAKLKNVVDSGIESDLKIWTLKMISIAEAKRTK